MHLNARRHLQRIWNLFKNVSTVIVMLVLAAQLLVFFTQYDLLPQQLNQAQSWNGLTPGVSTVPEMLSVLGRDVKAEYRNSSHWVYTYTDLPEVGWRHVELWALDRGTKRVIVGIFFQEPIRPQSDHPTMLNLRTLGEIAQRLGEPDHVSWTSSPMQRAPIWADSGVLVLALARFNDERFDQSKAPISALLLFQPMGPKRMMRTIYQLPWPNIPWIAPNNVYREGHTDSPDRLPQDPYNWELLTGSSGASIMLTTRFESQLRLPFSFSPPFRSASPCATLPRA